MKRLLIVLVWSIICLNGAFAQQSIMVQGHLRDDIKITSKGKSNQNQLRSVQSTFTFDDIEFWVGEGEKKAMLVIDWYFGGSQTLVWGYRWNGNACGLDMVMAVANADPRFTFLTHYTGGMGNTIAGFGYDVDKQGSQCLYYDGNTSTPICPVDGVVTTTAYNYDYWTPVDPSDYWRAGWYEGYWSYQVKDDIDGVFAYSGLGASSRMLSDGSVDGWGYQDGWDSWEGTIPRAPYTAAPKSVLGVSLNQSGATVRVGEVLTLTATVTPGDASNKNVSWSSSNESVATVSNGVVTAVGAGSAIITVTTVDGGFTATCDVASVIDATGVSLDKSEVTIPLGEQIELMATVTPDNATNKGVVWSSSNQSVAIIAGGVITATGIGTTTITVTTIDGGFKAKCDVTVIPVAVTGVTLDPETASLQPGETVQLVATVQPANATNQNIAWFYLSDSNAVIVNVDGTVRAIAPGQATITVKTEDGGFVATCIVTVVVRSSSGLNDVMIEELIAYPNPTQNMIWIKGTKANSTIRLYSISGSLLQTYLGQEDETSIDLSGFKAGVYFFNVEGSSLRIIKK